MIQSNSPIRDDDVPNADLTSPPTPVNESAPVPKDAIIDGWSWPPGVGGAEREDGAPGGSGGDFVERGDELGVDRGEAWWFWINQRNTLKKTTSICMAYTVCYLTHIYFVSCWFLLNGVIRCYNGRNPYCNLEHTDFKNRRLQYYTTHWFSG